jgi:alpha-N-arabinofuranosidase
MADAVFSAGFLNACLRHSDTVGMANMAPVVNTRGPLFVHPDGVVKRPTFHVLSMYANLLEANVVDAWVSGESLERSGKSVPAVDAVATCDDDRQAWSIALVNRHAATPATCQISLGDRL